MKKLVWVYRILLGLFLLAILILLAAKGLAVFWAVIGKPILLWFIGLYPPYSGYLLLGGILIGGILVMLSAAINALRAKRKPSEPLTEMLADAEASAVFQQLAEQCGVTLAEDDSEFCLAFQRPCHLVRKRWRRVHRWTDGQPSSRALFKYGGRTGRDRGYPCGEKSTDDFL